MSLLVDDKDIRIEGLQLGAWGTNAYIITCPATGRSALVDAPAEPGRILAALQGTAPQYILMTHGHFDHTGALAELKNKLGVPVAAHAADSLPVPPDMLLNDGDASQVGNLSLKVLHTPGHTPGGLCFLTGKYLFSGDTLFPGGPGRTSSPQAFRQVVAAITDKLFVLPDETRVFPGHGSDTVLGVEKAAYAAFAARQHSPSLCGDVLWASA